MRLPLSTRALLAKQFGFTKVGSIHVSNNQVVDDGYKVDDIDNAMTIERIQEYLQTKEKDHSLLWERLIEKIEGREIITAEVIPEEISPELEAELRERASQKDQFVPFNATEPITVPPTQLINDKGEVVFESKLGQPALVIEIEGEPAKQSYKAGDTMHVALPNTPLKKKPGRPKGWRKK